MHDLQERLVCLAVCCRRHQHLIHIRTQDARGAHYYNRAEISGKGLACGTRLSRVTQLVARFDWALSPSAARKSSSSDTPAIGLRGVTQRGITLTDNLGRKQRRQPSLADVRHVSRSPSALCADFSSQIDGC